MIYLMRLAHVDVRMGDFSVPMRLEMTNCFLFTKSSSD